MSYRFYFYDAFDRLPILDIQTTVIDADTREEANRKFRKEFEDCTILCVEEE